MEKDFKLLGDTLFPDVTDTADKYLKYYPRRDKFTVVTRFSPSPTGSLHIGGMLTALISEKYAHQSNGIFILRIEDTDEKREVINAKINIIRSLKTCGIDYDEGPSLNDVSKGNYGPYIQSERKKIYKVFIKALIQKGYAYPCFCTKHDLFQLNDLQKAKGESLTGYFGEYAKCRYLTLDQIVENLNNGKDFVIRYLSTNDENYKHKHHDLVRGVIELPGNIVDHILLKSDELPTYHLAHVIDDYLMGTTHIFRAEEWLSSLPLHLELFSKFEFPVPLYGHLSHIAKLEGTAKRKISKRSDPNASIDSIISNGYPPKAIIEYLMNIANSGFENWRKSNKSASTNEFQLTLDKLPASPAVFDERKLISISKKVLSNYDITEFIITFKNWCTKYQPDYLYLFENVVYLKRILNIFLGKRQDFSTWNEVYYSIFPFFDTPFKSKKFNFNINMLFEDMITLINEYMNLYSHQDTKDQWWTKIKSIGLKYGFITNKKSSTLGKTEHHISDLAKLYRICIFKKGDSPDLYEIMQILGESRVKERLNESLKYLATNKYSFPSK